MRQKRYGQGVFVVLPEAIPSNRVSTEETSDEADHAARPDSNGSGPPGPGNRMNCLLIEDDAETARYIRNGLKEAGFAVVWRRNGVDGLHSAITERWDVVILDRMLPGDVEGLAIIQAMRALGKTTPVLILSALGSLDDRVRGLRGGGDDYLTKPFACSELLARLQ